MSRIFITGDTHGNINIRKLNSDNFAIGNELTKDDYLIVCGDFGLVWDNSAEEQYWLNWLNSKPWTTLWVDGNHENFDLLRQYPTTEWNGGEVQFITDSIIHLKRGQIFTIDGKTFFTMGGAQSTDKKYRTEHISWWSDELPSWYEEELGLSTLEECGNKVDYIITHNGPGIALAQVDKYYAYSPVDPITTYFDIIYKTVEFKHWYFGHHHIDEEINSNVTCLYKEIIEV